MVKMWAVSKIYFVLKLFSNATNVLNYLGNSWNSNYSAGFIYLIMLIIL